ncbi:hypothetical protein N8I77_012171 [Diaporthe amygdali]|uniref:NmrA-like domain-containing protein n=1 Tax=Phomopsis amygdali TaxID=1214568 RepID=A0AAD9VXT4_PHOAM|nr:hypothetical protein N8I77_012171 [Diaporthe amygdali]
MPKIVTVIGATGIQGGSVIRALLDNPQYSLRAVTRNTKSDAAKALAARGVEVVEADINSVESLRAAFAGSYAIFAMTNFFDEALPTLGIDKAMELETRQGRNLADAAAATDSLSHYVWSTLPNSRRNTNGKLVVPYYESKNQVDDHIKTSHPELLRKTTFLWLAWYASNMRYPWYLPSEVRTADGSKKYIQLVGLPPSVKIPLLGDERTNAGLFVRAILERPDLTLPAKAVAGLDELLSLAEVAQAYGAAQGIEVRCVQIPKEDYRELWPAWGDLMDVSHSYYEVMGDMGFSSVDEHVLSKADLGVEGLVGTAEAFAGIKLSD